MLVINQQVNCVGTKFIRHLQIRRVYFPNCYQLYIFSRIFIRLFPTQDISVSEFPNPVESLGTSNNTIYVGSGVPEKGQSGICIFSWRSVS